MALSFAATSFRTSSLRPVMRIPAAPAMAQASAMAYSNGPVCQSVCRARPCQTRAWATCLSDAAGNAGDQHRLALGRELRARRIQRRIHVAVDGHGELVRPSDGIEVGVPR
jgi:hypothetical protein